MAKLAKGHSVAQIVVKTDAPRFDMSGVYDGVPVSGQHTHTTNRAAMIISCHYSASKTLIARRRSCLFLKRESSLISLLSSLFKQIPAVVVCFKNDNTLLHQSWMQFRQEVLVDKERAKALARSTVLQ